MILFFTQGQLEARLSARRVQRIFDDNNDGTADSAPLKQIRQDASSKVASYLEPVGLMPTLAALVNPTTGELLDIAKGFPEEVVRLSLDVGVALSCQRFPEVMRMEWLPLMTQAEKELCALRDAKTSLGGQGAPEAVNQGGAVLDGDATRLAPVPQRHFDDMGDF